MYCCLVKNPEKKTMIGILEMVGAPVVGLPVPSCNRSPCPPHHLSPLGPLLRTCSRCFHVLSLLSLTLSSSRFPFSPIPKNEMLLAACGTDLKNKKSRSVTVQSVSSPPVDAQSPSSFVVESSPLTAYEHVFSRAFEALCQ